MSVQRSVVTFLEAEMNLSVTVAVCTRDRSASLRTCLEALAGLNPAADDILVIDNTNGNEITRAISDHFGARYIVEPTVGLSHARNRALAESAADVIAYVDDDALPSPNWLGALLKPFSDPRVAVATGKIVDPRIPTDNREDTLRFVSNRDPGWFEIATFGGLGMGTNMAIRRTACDGIVLFDESLGRGALIQIAEENCAFATLLCMGYAAVYLPEAIVTHPYIRRGTIDQEARDSFAYWLFLFFQFRARRPDLIVFLFNRLKRKRLEWPRASQDPGDIINSGWRVQSKAVISGFFLFLRTRSRRKSYFSIPNSFKS